MKSRRPFRTHLLVLAIMTCVLATASAGEKKAAAPAPPLKVHPLVFSIIQGLLSDGDSPVVTEINLDVASTSRNQFDPDKVTKEDEWTRSPGTDANGFLRYRVLKSKGQHYTVEYQENGGGTLTLAAIIEFSVEKREIRVEGKPTTIHVLRVLSYHTK